MTLSNTYAWADCCSWCGGTDHSEQHCKFDAPGLQIRYRRHSLFGVSFYRDDPAIDVNLPELDSFGVWWTT